MADHRADRAALDAAILEHLRIGRGHPRHAKPCYDIALKIKQWNPSLEINNRLQVLRKAGRVQWEGSLGEWVLSNA